MFFQRPAPGELRPRLPRLLLGLVLCGLGLAMIITADLGLAPWDVLHQGISRHTGIPIGTVGILVGLVVVAIWAPLGEPIGFGTLANVVIVGLVIDGTLWLLPDDFELPVRVALLLGGVVVMGLGSGFYIGVRLGAGPRDGLMTSLAARGWSVRRVRTLLEVGVLALGVLLGGSAGVGTLVFALGIGPVVHVFLDRLALDPPQLR